MPRPRPGSHRATAWLLGLLATGAAAAAAVVPTRQGTSDDMRPVPGGTFTMGADDAFHHEGPAHAVALRPFLIDHTEVTVADFERFVRATGHVTDAERRGWSSVFDPAIGAWREVEGAEWRRPDGPSSRARADEPVTQVTWADAAAYARWAGKRLPTEAEFERAARGGLEGSKYAWGDDLIPGGRWPLNIWQGPFPVLDAAEDGHAGRAPAGSFPPNGFGVNDLAGNVWEWCADWYDPAWYDRSPVVDPRGPDAGARRVIRGGSWLCSENNCTGYRAAARMRMAPDTATNHIGFRCVRDR